MYLLIKSKQIACIINHMATTCSNCRCPALWLQRFLYVLLLQCPCVVLNHVSCMGSWNVGKYFQEPFMLLTFIKQQCEDMVYVSSAWKFFSVHTRQCVSNKPMIIIGARSLCAGVNVLKAGEGIIAAQNVVIVASDNDFSPEYYHVITYPAPLPPQTRPHKKIFNVIQRVHKGAVQYTWMTIFFLTEKVVKLTTSLVAGCTEGCKNDNHGYS